MLEAHMLAAVVSSPRRSVTSSTQCPRLSPLRAASGTGSSRCTCIIARVAVSTRLGQSISRASGRGRGSANFAPEDFVTRGDNLWQNTVAPKKKDPHMKRLLVIGLFSKRYFIKSRQFLSFTLMAAHLLTSSKCVFPSGSPPKPYACLFSPICDVHHPPYPSWSNCLNNIWWGVQIMKLLIMQFYPSPCSFPTFLVCGWSNVQFKFPLWNEGFPFQ